MQNGQKSTITTMLLWVIAAGAGTGGLTGIGALDELNSMNVSIQEQVRQAERRGEILAEIASIRRTLERHEVRLSIMMPREGIMALHEEQKILINKLIDFTSEVATKSELELSVKKLQSQLGGK